MTLAAPTILQATRTPQAGWGLGEWALAAYLGYEGVKFASKYFDKESTKERDARRWKELMEKHYTGVDDYLKQTAKTMPVSPNFEGEVSAKYAPDAVGYDNANKVWVNNKFAESRDEKALRPEDVWGSQDVIGAVGNDYFGKWDEARRRAYSQALLDANIIQERKGGIDIIDKDKAAEIRKQTDALTAEDLQKYGSYSATAESASGGAPSGTGLTLKFITGNATDPDEQNRRALAATLTNNAITQGTSAVRTKIGPWSETMNRYLYGNSGYGY